MNILFISFSSVPLIGGTGRSFSMLQALVDAGNKIDLLTPAPTEKGRGSIRVIGEGRRVAHTKLGFRLLVLWTLLRGKYDVVHAVDKAAFFVFRLCKKRGKPSFVYDAVYRIKDHPDKFKSYLMRFFSRYYQQCEKKILQRADLVFTGCDILTADLKGVCKEASIVQLGGVPVQLMTPHDGSTEDLFNWFERRPTYLLTGVCHSDKPSSYKKVLLSARKVLDVVPDAVFVLKANGDTTTMEEIANNLDIIDRCIFVTPQAPEVFLEALRLADVVFYVPPDTSRYLHDDLFSLLFSGAPLVSTMEMEGSQVLTDENSIPVLFAVESLVGGLLRAIQEPLFSYQLAVEAQKLISNSYSYSSFKHNLRMAYNKLGN